MFSHFTDDLGAQWRVSTRSGGANCVEVATIETMIAVRDSKDKRGPVLVYTASTWSEFIAAAKSGAFDQAMTHH